MHESHVNKRRRNLLRTMVGVAGMLGAGASVARVMFRTEPSEPEPPPSNEPVEVDISKLEPGQRIVVEWYGNPAWIVRRSESNLKDLPTLNDMLTDPHSTNPEQQPAYAQNLLRSIRPDIVVLLGVCTHLGCSPYYRPDIAPEDIGQYWKGGFLCPCHGSRYDLAGRVFKFVPAQDNLPVPPHRYLSDERILIGDDSVDS
jgi:ubiquinol-cytochrome c reductase iron-sulfur subunit